MAARGGIKIYRASSGYKKRKARKAAKIILFVIVLAVLVFLGYCVANSVSEYLSDNNEIISAEEDTVPWTPPESPDEPEDILGAADESAGEISEDEKDVQQEQPVEEDNGFSAYRLPVTALSSAASLNEELAFAKEAGYSAVIAVMKDAGGKIYYKTSSEMAVTDETAVVGDMYPTQICSIIRSAGFIPIAEVNILEDNNRYGMNRDGSYHVASDNSAWLDNSPAKGGKPWLSPFEEKTRNYADFLANEVASSGFEYVVYGGLVFPDFRNSDLNYIGDTVRSADRYKALISIENSSAGITVQNDSIPILMTSAGKILNGKAEVFKPAEISSGMIAVSYVPDEIGGTVLINGQEAAVSDLSAYDRAKAVLGEVKRLAGDNKTIIPVIRQSDFSQADYSDIIAAAMDLEMDSYIVL